MGRLVRLKRGRSPLHAVEETIAALYEELQFTLNFAHAMVRDQNYRAAAEAIDEQRRSLVRASGRIEHALRAPEIARSKMRTRAALAGIAAVLALGTGAFAAFGPGSTPRPPSKIQTIRDAGKALEAAVTISDPVALSRIVVPAQERILDAARSVATNPQVKATLLDSVETLQKVISNPALPPTVRERAKEVAETVQQIAVAVPEPVPPEEETDGATEEAPAEAPSAPAAP